MSDRRPLLCAVQQAKHLDARGAQQPIDHDERRTPYHQFTRAPYPPRPSQFRLMQQHVDLTFYLFVLIGCRQWVVLSDVIELMKAVQCSAAQPLDDQAGLRVFLVGGLAVREGARQAARRFALSAITSSFDAHAVVGSRASFSACATCARTHLSCAKAACACFIVAEVSGRVLRLLAAASR